MANGFHVGDVVQYFSHAGIGVDDVLLPLTKLQSGSCPDRRILRCRQSHWGEDQTFLVHPGVWIVFPVVSERDRPVLRQPWRGRYAFEA